MCRGMTKINDHQLRTVGISLFECRGIPPDQGAVSVLRNRLMQIFTVFLRHSEEGDRGEPR